MRNNLDVKAARGALGFTQAQLADAVGVDQSTVSNWEKGKPPKGPARIIIEQLLRNAPASNETASQPERAA